jgi:hypothetical protein
LARFWRISSIKIKPAKIWSYYELLVTGKAELLCHNFLGFNQQTWITKDVLSQFVRRGSTGDLGGLGNARLVFNQKKMVMMNDGSIDLDT